MKIRYATSITKVEEDKHQKFIHYDVLMLKEGRMQKISNGKLSCSAETTPTQLRVLLDSVARSVVKSQVKQTTSLRSLVGENTTSTMEI